MMPAIYQALYEPCMIDKAAYDAIREAVLRHKEGSAFVIEDVRAVSARPGKPLENARRATHRDGVATIPVRGPIVRHGTAMTALCGLTSVDAIAGDLQTAIDNPMIKHVCMEFDSPGGSVTGIAELAHRIRAMSKVKPICGFVDGQACSAAYYLASACPELVSTDWGRVGSIGVIAAIPPKDAGKNEPVEFVSSQSPMKNPDPNSEAGHAEYQAMVDELAALFVKDVADFRGTSEETVKSEFGRGGVKIGESARKAGMVDRLGDYESLHAELAGRTKTVSTPYRLSSEGKLQWVSSGSKSGDESMTQALSMPSPLSLPKNLLLPARRNLSLPTQA